MLLGSTLTHHFWIRLSLICFSYQQLQTHRYSLWTHGKRRKISKWLDLRSWTQWMCGIFVKKCNYYQHFLFVNRLNNRDKINEDHTVCEEDRNVFLIIILINVSLILSLALRQFIIMTRIEQHELLMCWMFLSALHNCDLEGLMIVGQLLLRVLQEVLIGCHRGNAVLMLTEAKKQFEHGDLF